MITYEPFFKTLKEKRITTYYLINQCGFSKGTLDSLRQGRNITIYTLDYLCQLLDCGPEDIISYTPDNTSPVPKQSSNPKHPSNPKHASKNTRKTR